jgi:hypothetical protein
MCYKTMEKTTRKRPRDVTINLTADFDGTLQQAEEATRPPTEREADEYSEEGGGRRGEGGETKS